METNKHHQTRARYYNSPIITQDSELKKKKENQTFPFSFFSFSHLTDLFPLFPSSLLTSHTFTAFLKGLQFPWFLY